jgi:hypothetical protein
MLTTFNLRKTLPVLLAFDNSLMDHTRQEANSVLNQPDNQIHCFEVTRHKADKYVYLGPKTSAIDPENISTDVLGRQGLCAIKLCLFARLSGRTG